jgi:NitT/TauT family transport system permease protein
MARGTFGRLLTPKVAIPKSIEIGVGLAVAGILLGGWCLLTYGGVVSPNFLPAPHEVVAALVRTTANGTLIRHIGVSIEVIYSGFFLSSILAIPIGILMGSFRIVAAAIEPVVNFVRYLPVTAMIPLLILWIGIGIEEKIAVIFIGTFFQQIVLIADVSAQVPRDLLNVSYTLGARRRQVVSRVLVPATMPGVMDTLRVTMGWAWTYLVVAELVAADAGLGYMSLQAMRGLHPEVIFLAIFVIGFLGLATDQVFKLIRAWTLPWAENR